MMSINLIIILIISIMFVLTIGIIGGSMGWKLACLNYELKTISTEKLSMFDFQNGDLLLFSAGMQSFSSVHMLIADCPITHIGMVVVNPKNGLLRCWELSWGWDIPDMICLTNLYNTIQSYKGTVLVRKLRKKYYTSNESSDQTLSSEETYREIRKIQQEHRENPKRYRSFFYLNTYDSRTSEYMFMHPPLPINSMNQTDREWICSDLISETYFRLGVFSSVDLSLWPRDFYSKKEKFPLSYKWCFSNEIRLENDILKK